MFDFSWQSIVAGLPGLIIALVIHEYAHARVAVATGDFTPKMMGRLTLNPRAHIDPIGLLMLFFVGFGWGKPVLIDPRQFRHPRRDQIIVGLAGVFNNFVTAVVFAVICRLYVQFVPNAFFISTLGNVIFTILIQTVSINISLMLFNLLPIPPLDGFGVVCGIFGLYNTKFYWYARRYGMPLLLILVYFGFTANILGPLSTSVFRFVIRIATIGM